MMKIECTQSGIRAHRHVNLSFSVYADELKDDEIEDFRKTGEYRRWTLYAECPECGLNWQIRTVVDNA